MRFEVISETIERDNGELVEMYGVQVLCGQEVLRRAPALSPDEVRVTGFATLLEDYDPSPLHLGDLLEDFVCAIS